MARSLKARTLVVGNDLDLAVLEDTDARVRGAEIDSDSGGLGHLACRGAGWKMRLRDRTISHVSKTPITILARFRNFMRIFHKMSDPSSAAFATSFLAKLKKNASQSITAASEPQLIHVRLMDVHFFDT